VRAVYLFRVFMTEVTCAETRLSERLDIRAMVCQDLRDV